MTAVTTATQTLRAYHGSEELKAKVLAQIAEHRRLDQIVQGQYWANGDGRPFRGCAVGCLTHDPNGGHEQYETRWGIPAQLAWLEDGIFEALPADKAMEWPERFMGAIPVGADLSTVWPRFAIWLMIDPEWGLVNATDAQNVKAVCRKVAAGYEQILGGGISGEDAVAITDAAWDAWAARVARDAWAARATRAAWAARSAWDARATRAARDARDAWDARDARDAWDARDAFVAASAENLIDLLESA